MIIISCTKNDSENQVNIQAIEYQKKLSVIVLLGDGMGISQLTAAWHKNLSLNVQDYPYSGLMLVHSNDKIIGESGSSNTAMMTGVKTNYGYLGIDMWGTPQETLYEYLRKKDYKTGMISTTYITDATLAALYTHRETRYAHEEIAVDFIRKYPDFAVSGGQKHFDAREDGLNLIDSLKSNNVSVFSNLQNLLSHNHLPVCGFMHESLPPYLLDGRSDFLYQASQKALNMFNDDPFFLFIEGGQIDLAGHDMNIENQVEETIEFDEVAGLALKYAKNNENVLVVVLSDHETGGLSLLQGEGMNYIANYAEDEHSAAMVPIFAYGPGAEKFTGIIDNSDIHDLLKSLIDTHLN